VVWLAGAAGPVPACPPLLPLLLLLLLELLLLLLELLVPLLGTQLGLSEMSLPPLRCQCWVQW
jgi:hypothetical protein